MLDARALREAIRHLFVSTLFVGNKVYVILMEGKREPKTIIADTQYPSGIEFHKGTLYFATHKQIVRYDNIEDKLDNLGQADGVVRQTARRG
ncbi:MAG: hypothetical protein R3E68_20205 [Burkholderiaceae bacterium]